MLSPISSAQSFKYPIESGSNLGFYSPTFETPFRDRPVRPLPENWSSSPYAPPLCSLSILLAIQAHSHHDNSTSTLCGLIHLTYWSYLLDRCHVSDATRSMSLCIQSSPGKQKLSSEQPLIKLMIKLLSETTWSSKTSVAHHRFSHFKSSEIHRTPPEELVTLRWSGNSKELLTPVTAIGAHRC